MLTARDGENVTCEGAVVERIAARNNPAYFVGSSALCQNGLVYVGNYNGWFYALDATDVSSVVDSASPTGGWIRSTPAIAYLMGDNAQLQRWVFITSKGDGGTLTAYSNQ